MFNISKNQPDWQPYWTERGKEYYRNDPDVPQYEIEKAMIDTMLQTLQPKTLLDAGCGYGRFFDLFDEYGVNFQGVDFSITQLTNVPEKYSDRVREARLDSLPFRPDCFDVIFTCTVLQHINNLSEVLNEFQRVCKSWLILIEDYDTTAKNIPRGHFTWHDYPTIVSQHGFDFRHIQRVKSNFHRHHHIFVFEKVRNYVD